MNKTFYIGMKISNYYAVYINDNEFAEKEMVEENDIDGFIQCLKFLGYEEK